MTLLLRAEAAPAAASAADQKQLVDFLDLSQRQE